MACAVLLGLWAGCGDGGGGGGGGAGASGIGGTGGAGIGGGGAGGSGGWQPIATLDAPEARADVAVAWTGTELVVWGGTVYGSGAAATPYSNGGRYDPKTDKWRPMAVSRAPTPRSGALSGWTGSEMLVFGGTSPGAVYGNGGLYDPAINVWRDVRGDGPTAAGGFGGCRVFTGSEVFVIGGQYDGSGSATWKARRLALASGAWSDWTLTGAPPLRDTQCVWTGREVVFWGGQDPLMGSRYSDGGRFDVSAGTWRALGGRNPPAARYGHRVVWAGNALYVIGGYGDMGEQLGSVRWDPGTDEWRALSFGTRSGRLEDDYVVTPRGLVSLGTQDDAGSAIGPRVFDDATQRWTSLPTLGAPSPRVAAAAVYTGSELIVWGGRGVDFRQIALDDGARIAF